MAHRTIWVNRFPLKKRDYLLVNDGTFGIDEETSLASRMYAGVHEHCNHMICIRRHRAELWTYLTLSCGSPRCPFHIRIKFKTKEAMEAFTFEDLRQHCRKQMSRRHRQKRRLRRLLALDLNKLEALLVEKEFCLS